MPRSCCSPASAPSSSSDRSATASSTSPRLERREHALRHELELNRRTAPQLYRRVLPVTARARWQAGTRWRRRARRMAAGDAPLPRRRQLDRIAAATDRSRPSWSTARRGRGGVAGRSTAASRPGWDRGHARDRRRQRRGPDARRCQLVFAAAESRAGPGDAGPLLGAARRRCWSSAAQPASSATATVTSISANIVLLDGRPMLFDCIEFDDEFACIDVLYDLAFLVMDLIEKRSCRRGEPACSTAGWSAPPITPGWRSCHCSCRCARRSAPRSSASPVDTAAPKRGQPRPDAIWRCGRLPASAGATRACVAIGGGSGHRQDHASPATWRPACAAPRLVRWSCAAT